MLFSLSSSYSESLYCKSATGILKNPDPEDIGKSGKLPCLLGGQNMQTRSPAKTGRHKVGKSALIAAPHWPTEAIQYLAIIVLSAMAMSAVVRQVLISGYGDWIPLTSQRSLIIITALASGILGGFFGSKYHPHFKNWLLALSAGCFTLALIWGGSYFLLPQASLWASTNGNLSLLLMTGIVGGSGFVGSMLMSAWISGLFDLWEESAPFSRRLSVAQKFFVYSLGLLLALGIPFGLLSFFRNQPLIQHWIGGLEPLDWIFVGFTALIACREGFQRRSGESIFIGMMIAIIAMGLWSHAEAILLAWGGDHWKFTGAIGNDVENFVAVWRAKLLLMPCLALSSSVAAAFGAMAYKDFNPRPIPRQGAKPTSKSNNMSMKPIPEPMMTQTKVLPVQSDKQAA